MSHRKDTEYLAISARVRAMENRLLTRERMDRIIDARDEGEARKVLAECGYPEAPGASLESVLTQVREQTRKELLSAIPDGRLLEIFTLKYDYHNAKTILKAEAVGTDPSRLLLSGGRYEPAALLEGWQREQMGLCSDTFRKAMLEANAVLKDSRDPQRADLLLDKAYFGEMAQLAKGLESKYLQGYVRLMVDAANLRTVVRVSRMCGEDEFLRGVLLEGGNVLPQTILSARGGEITEPFRSGALAKAAELGAAVAKPDSGALTVFERACDDAVTAYLAAARRVPFGEEVVIGYLYAREQEITAIRSIFAGRAAGLEEDVIRQRLRETYV